MVLKMVFKQQRLQRRMHSKVMTDKHVFCSMTVFVSFMNTSWKHLRMKPTPDLHLTYRKNGDKSGVGMKLSIFNINP